MEEKYAFRVPQKAVIKKDGKYLLVKRSSTAKHFPNYWDLPGGKLEHGEEMSYGLAREIFEETNLVAKVLSQLFVYLEKSSHAVVILFECELISGELSLSKEHTEYRWCTKEEALKLQLEPFLEAFFRQTNIK